jgi:hypothetical protein
MDYLLSVVRDILAKLGIPEHRLKACQPVAFFKIHPAGPGRFFHQNQIPATHAPKPAIHAFTHRKPPPPPPFWT